MVIADAAQGLKRRAPGSGWLCLYVQEGEECGCGLDRTGVCPSARMLLSESSLRIMARSLPCMHALIDCTRESGLPFLLLCSSFPHHTHPSHSHARGHGLDWTLTWNLLFTFDSEAGVPEPDGRGLAAVRAREPDHQLVLCGRLGLPQALPHTLLLAL